MEILQNRLRPNRRSNNRPNADSNDSVISDITDDTIHEDLIDLQNLIQRNGGRTRIPLLFHIFLNIRRNRQRERGLTQEQFDRLNQRSFILNPNTPENEAEKCTICFEDFEDGEIVKELPCLHMFHPDCIKTWILRNPKCPICKADSRV